MEEKIITIGIENLDKKILSMSGINDRTYILQHLNMPIQSVVQHHLLTQSQYWKVNNKEWLPWIYYFSKANDNRIIRSHGRK